MRQTNGCREAAKGITLVLALAALPMAAFAQDEEAHTAEPNRIPAVSIATAETSHFKETVAVTGTLVAREEVQVYPQVTGFTVNELVAEIGDEVQAGQVLAVIDDRTLGSKVTQANAELARANASLRQATSQVASAEANLHQAEQALQRTQSLRDSGSATQASLDNAIAAEQSARASYDAANDGVAVAEAAMAQAQAALDVAERDYENAHVTAPVAGIVSERNAELGMIASVAGNPMFRLIRDGQIELLADVVETELVKLEVGQTVQLNVAGLPSGNGTVRLVPPVVDSRTRLGEVRISIESQEGLRPGMFASGTIMVTERDNLGVPSTAVLSAENGSKVLTVVDGIVHEVEVTPGLIYEGQREILDGIDAGTEVLARAGAFFGEGDEVQPLQDAADMEHSE